MNWGHGSTKGYTWKDVQEAVERVWLVDPTTKIRASTGWKIGQLEMSPFRQEKQTDSISM